MTAIKEWFENFISYKLEGFGWQKEVVDDALKFTSISGAVRTCKALEKLDESCYDFDKVCTYISDNNLSFIVSNWDILKQKSIAFYFVNKDLSYYFTFNPWAHKNISDDKSLNKSLNLLKEHAKLR